MAEKTWIVRILYFEVCKPFRECTNGKRAPYIGTMIPYGRVVFCNGNCLFQCLFVRTIGLTVPIVVQIAPITVFQLISYHCSLNIPFLPTLKIISRQK